MRNKTQPRIYLPKTDFSLSVFKTFLSSRFFNFPGASAIGSEL